MVSVASDNSSTDSKMTTLCGAVLEIEEIIFGGHLKNGI